MNAEGLIDAFFAEHRRIEVNLAVCEQLLADVNALHTRLLHLRPMLLEHLHAKDAFYVALVNGCAEAGDLPSTNVAKMYEENMRVQSSAVRRFFAALDTQSSPLLAQSFKTMALIIRGRLAQEERAVFPLYLKHPKV
ncbi:MAG: hemerythrin domain-containing protein [Myxococcaceae bacterium]|nr:hemerythrin domain-containing protein [Myxococcaceae bacterium]